MEHLKQLQAGFVNRKFGMFIHFNSATVQFNTGAIGDWEYGHENGGEPRRYPFNPAGWNPSALDCSLWADLAAAAGMKFAALTSKHHEGFCLWPTATTEHCVRNATFRHDVVGAYLEAFRARGIAAGLYFSILDLTRRLGRSKCTGGDIAYTKDQITELLTQYGEIPFLIIDGWGSPWGGPGFDILPFAEIRTLVTKLQPDCLLLNVGETRNPERTDILFFESAAGQAVAKDFAGPGISCDILTKTWFWRQEDAAAELKGAEWAVNRVKTLNAQNTAFILNLSPNPTGGVDANMAARFREIGAVMGKPD